MPQRKKTVKIPEWAEQILRGSEFDDDGKLVRLPQQLERSSYVEIDKILKALGGKWNRGRKAHVFPSDARVLLGAAFESGEALDKNKTFEQFDTPPELARRMVELAEISNYDDVLEPSAGIGNLLEALFDGNPPGYVQAIELDLDRANGLREKFSDIGIWQGDFLAFCDGMDPRPFDAVLMNPPFSNNQDIRHVRHAWNFLRPGGRLVAIISPHSIFAEEKICFEFRQWLREIGAEVDVLEEGTFAESGTPIRAQLIVAIKGEMEAVKRYDPDWPPKSKETPDQRDGRIDRQIREARQRRNPPAELPLLALMKSAETLGSAGRPPVTLAPTRPNKLTTATSDCAIIPIPAMEIPMNAFEAKRAARKDRQADRAERLQREADASFRNARAAIAGIPPGQPILVGHHSEKRHRRDLERHDSRMRKGVELQKLANEAAHRATTESSAISSDDPDAPDKIRERIAKLERKQELMIAANKIYRSKKLTADQKIAQIIALGLSQDAARGGLTPDFAGRLGIQGYSLQLNNANIRRLKERLELLEKQRTAEPHADIVGDGWVIREDVEDNRILIIFDGKPDATRRAKLKSNGFRWSPSRGAWVRQLNNRARFWAQQAVQ